MQLSWDIKGGAALKKKLKSIDTVKVRPKVSKALLAAGEIVVAAAKKRTPVDTGALRANVNMTPYNITSEGGNLNIAYLQEYAPYVHERLELRHRVGEAKFLENAIMDGSVRAVALNVINRVLKF
jgi:hypothetical protein